jgi:hypothetical protein
MRPELCNCDALEGKAPSLNSAYIWSTIYVYIRVLVGKPEGKRPLGRPRRRWEVIKMDLQEVGYGTWSGLIRLRIGTGGGYL